MVSRGKKTLKISRAHLYLASRRALTTFYFTGPLSCLSRSRQDSTINKITARSHLEFIPNEPMLHRKQADNCWIKGREQCEIRWNISRIRRYPCEDKLIVVRREGDTYPVIHTHGYDNLKDSTIPSRFAGMWDDNHIEVAKKHVRLRTIKTISTRIASESETNINKCA